MVQSCSAHIAHRAFCVIPNTTRRISNKTTKTIMVSVSALVTSPSSIGLAFAVIPSTTRRISNKTTKTITVSVSALVAGSSSIGLAFAMFRYILWTITSNRRNEKGKKKKQHRTARHLILILNVF
jgi:hypothetical protein